MCVDFRMVAERCKYCAPGLAGLGRGQGELGLGNRLESHHRFACSNTVRIHCRKAQRGTRCAGIRNRKGLSKRKQQEQLCRRNGVRKPT